MAARKKKLKLEDSWREKIRIGVIIDRLAKHIEGEIEMSPTQIRAAEILLKKVAPDLSATDFTGEVIHQYVMRTPHVSTSVEHWQQQHPEVTLQ